MFKKYSKVNISWKKDLFLRILKIKIKNIGQYKTPNSASIFSIPANSVDAGHVSSNNSSTMDIYIIQHE